MNTNDTDDFILIYRYFNRYTEINVKIVKYFVVFILNDRAHRMFPSERLPAMSLETDSQIHSRMHAHHIEIVLKCYRSTQDCFLFTKISL